MRGTTALSLALWLSLPVALAPASCGGESPASGVTALLRATNGQYEAGELATDPGAMEPTVDTIKSNNTRVYPGAQGRSVSGSVNGAASAILVGLAGDNAHWLLPVGMADLDMVGNFTFSTTLSFSPDLPLGERALNFRAIDADGQLGPVQALTLKVDAPAPTGALVIQLVWDTEADLDLHVRIQNPTNTTTPYFDVWARAPRALPPKPPGEMDYTQAELDAGGRLLFDSNAQCVIDGQRHEEVVFPGTFPPGPYEVRVDTVSLCGEPTARWHAVAYFNTPDAQFAEANGQSTDRDTIATHAADSGTLAFTLNP
jgi:hypothetical protein